MEQFSIVGSLSNTTRLDSLVAGDYYRQDKIAGELYSIHVGMRPKDLEYDPPQLITSEHMLTEIEKSKEDGICSELLSPIQKGDMRNSIVTFLTACVGAGVLSVPQIFSFYGIILSVFLCGLCAFFNYESYKVIDQAMIMSGRRGYGNLCSYYFGERWAKVCNIGIMTVLFVVSCIYASITWNFLENMLGNNGIVSLPISDPNTGQIQEYASKTIIVRAVSMVVVAALCFPLLLFRQLSALRYVTGGIMIVICYIFLITLIQTPGSIKHYQNKDSYHIDIFPPEFTMNWISGIGALSMSFSCQPVYFYIRNEMIHKTRQRTKRIYKIGLLIEFTIYVLFGLCGYLSLGKNNVPVIFTQRISVFEKDILMSIARWVFCPLIALHVLLPFITLRESIIQYNNIKRTKKNVFLLSLVLTIFVFALPVIYPDVLSLMGIFGGLFSGFFGCIVFFMIGLKTAKSTAAKAKYFVYIVIFIWSAFANTYVSIYEVFTS